MASLDAARRMMIDGQIRTNDVTDRRILGAFGRVPRESFVPPAQAPIAYLDRDLPVGNGRVLLKPMVLAKLLQAVDLPSQGRVLDVGCATGYSAAILAAMGLDVVAVESEDALAATASRVLLDLGYAVTLRRGSLMEGAPSDGPYDVIVIEGAVEHVPAGLLAQLKEAGRLVCVRHDNGSSRATLYVAGETSGRPLFDANAPLLAGFSNAKQFVF